MTSIIIRILLRYVAAALVAKGLLAPDDGTALGADADIAMLLETGVGIIIGSATEVWWWLTKPSAEATEVATAVDKGQKVIVEGPRGGETVVQKDVKP